MLLCVCTARDRFHLYLKARRFAMKGGLAICDRYPLPQIKMMDGPNISHASGGTQVAWLVDLMRKLEAEFYRRILAPDLLMVLAVDPEIAVKRKIDECEAHVRSRSREVWGLNWGGSCARVIDASQAKEQVVWDLKRCLWSEL
jgi:thymidylate kinase